MKPILVLLSLLLLAACGERPAPPPQDTYPWQIEVSGNGHSRVFGVTLGRSTLGEAAGVLGDDYKLAMFEDRDGRLSLEAFYNEITRGGLSARLVLVLDGQPAELAGLRDRAVNRRVLETGNVRYTPSPADQRACRDRVVVGLDYLPYVNLDAGTILARFGEPAEKIAVGKGREHWLYPGRGLDILLNEDGRELLQYVPPADFARLVRPLREHPYTPPNTQ